MNHSKQMKQASATGAVAFKQLKRFSEVTQMTTEAGFTQLKPVHAKVKRAVAFSALAVAVLSTAPVSVSLAESTPALVEASIPFANYGGIRDWQPDRDRGLWVQSVHRKWYYARFMGTCIGLNFATAIGFDTHPLGSFDRWSTVIVPRYGRCTVQSLSLSDGPPKKPKKVKGGAGANAAAADAGATDKSGAALKVPNLESSASGSGAGAPAAGEPLPVAPASGNTTTGEVILRNEAAGELVNLDTTPGLEPVTTKLARIDPNTAGSSSTEK